MYQVLQIVFPIFAIVFAGYFYARWHWPDMASANRLNIDVFIPALIFSVLADKNLVLEDYGLLALLCVPVVLGSGPVAWAFGRFLGYENKVFLPPMMFNNSGNMGLPLALFAFGEDALSGAMILFLVSNMLHFTVGNAMISGELHPLRLLKLPIPQATFAGVAFNLLEIPVWPPLFESIDLLGQISIPLMLFALGVRMRSGDFSDWKIGAVGAVVCPLSSLLIALPLVLIVDLPPVQEAQLLIFSVLPPAVLNFMLAEKYQVDPGKVAAIVLLGNFASLFVIPVALYFVL